MVAVYVSLILEGLWTLDRVPKFWKDDVKKELEKYEEDNKED